MDEKQRLEKEVFEAEVQAARARAAKAAFDQLGATERVALAVHDLLCHSEHAEACGWFYEIHHGIHDWSGQTHVDALKRAQHLLTKFPEDTTLGVIKALKERV